MYTLVLDGCNCHLSNSAHFLCVFFPLSLHLSFHHICEVENFDCCTMDGIGFCFVNNILATDSCMAEVCRSNVSLFIPLEKCDLIHFSNINLNAYKITNANSKTCTTLTMMLRFFLIF